MAQASQTIREAIMEVSFPFKREILFPHLLFLALDSKIISFCLDLGRSLDDLARFTHMDPYRLHLLLEAMRDFSVLKQTNGKYQVSCAAVPLFTKGRPAFLGDQLEAYRRAWERIYDLNCCFRSRGRSSRDRKQTETYLSAVLKFNQPWIKKIMRKLNSLLPAGGEVLDIGGGHGIYASELIKKRPGTNATIFDLKHAIDFCRQIHGETTYFKRMFFLKGDILKSQIQQKYDLVMINDLLHYFSIDQKELILQKAYASVKDGGHLVVSKFHLRGTKDGLRPVDTLYFAVKNLIQSGRGYLETDSETKQLLEKVACRRALLQTDTILNKTLFCVSK